MELCPSSEAAVRSDTEELPEMLWNPEVHRVPCSQEFSTGPYPEPYQPSSYRPIL
jgi:hypothetical protein